MVRNDNIVKKKLGYFFRAEVINVGSKNKVVFLQQISDDSSYVFSVTQNRKPL